MHLRKSKLNLKESVALKISATDSFFCCYYNIFRDFPKHFLNKSLYSFERLNSSSASPSLIVWILTEVSKI